MKTPTLTTAALALLGLASPAASQSSTSCSRSLEPSGYPRPVMAGGWVSQLAYSGLTSPRGIVLENDGLLVLEQRTGIKKLTFDGNGCFTGTSVTVIRQSDLNHGLELSEDGKTLYASSANEVYSWEYDSASGTVKSDSRKTLVTGMLNPGHSSRTLMLSRKANGMLLVSRGSASNMDNSTRELSSGISQIRAFDLNNLPQGRPYTYSSEGRIIGWGLRNSVGIAEHPTTGGLYSVENSADNVHRMTQDIHTDNPGEELNFHGILNNASAQQEQGGNYGYPDCFALWDTNVPEVGSMRTGSQFALERTDRINDEICEKDYVAPRLTFPAHTAPLDIKFSQDGNEAYITFHGSWNRDEPIGYQVALIKFANGEPTEPSDSRSPTEAIMSNGDLSGCPGNCFRPVGLAADKQGRVYVSSDSSGDIYILQKAEMSATGGGNGSSGAAQALGQSDIHKLWATLLMVVAFILV